MGNTLIDSTIPFLTDMRVVFSDQSAFVNPAFSGKKKYEITIFISAESSSTTINLQPYQNTLYMEIIATNTFQVVSGIYYAL